MINDVESLGGQGWLKKSLGVASIGFGTSAENMGAEYGFDYCTDPAVKVCGGQNERVSRCVIRPWEVVLTVK